jgi:osmotically-inducible protein OsmY
VTIQRRWVFLEGCVATRAEAARLEQAARRVADVESVVPMLALPGEAPRYQVLDGALTSPR